MDLIVNNPFRVLGLPIIVSERDIARRTSDMAIYTAMDRIVSFYRDFPALGPIARTPETVALAARQIERPQNRLFFSLFWFWNRNLADERALKCLVSGKARESLLILEKAVGRGPIGADNYSSAKNLSIIYLSQSFDRSAIKTGNLQKGLNVAGRMFQSPLTADYIRLVAGEAAVMNPANLERAFADEIFYCLDRHRAGGLTDKTTVNLFQTFGEPTQQFIIGKVINTPMEKIETEIDKSRSRRTNDPPSAVETGKLLFKRTLNDMMLLRSILSRSNIIFRMISDKLANEVLQCAIDAFNLSVKQGEAARSDIKPLILVKCASTIAIGERTRIRIYESFAAIRNWGKMNIRS